jgi:hypothetical protein
MQISCVALIRQLAAFSPFVAGLGIQPAAPGLVDITARFRRVGAALIQPGDVVTMGTVPSVICSITPDFRFQRLTTTDQRTYSPGQCFSRDTLSVAQKIERPKNTRGLAIGNAYTIFSTAQEIPERSLAAPFYLAGLCRSDGTITEPALCKFFHPQSILPIFKISCRLFPEQNWQFNLTEVGLLVGAKNIDPLTVSILAVSVNRANIIA